MGGSITVLDTRSPGSRLLRSTIAIWGEQSLTVTTREEFSQPHSENVQILTPMALGYIRLPTRHRIERKAETQQYHPWSHSNLSN